MNVFKRIFASSLSLILSVIAGILNLLFLFPGLFILKIPLWLALIITGIISFVPVFGSLLNIVLWIWAFIVCLNSPISTISVIFYILFTLNAVNIIQATIRAIIAPNQ